MSKLLCAVSLLTLSITTATANPYDGVVFFGDSLTDSGYYMPAMKQVGLDTKQAGKFTINPSLVWSEVLGNKMGVSITPNIPYANQSGNNYAIGGARAGVDGTQLGVPTLSVKNQLNTHLTKGALNPHALHAVWVGANDLFAIKADPTNAQRIVLDAVKDNIEVIKTLHNEGAKYILLANLPDIGQTPQSILAGNIAQAQATQTAQLYNNMLLDGVKTTGANVIVLDTFSLLQEVSQNPSAYGFKNVHEMACQGNSLTCHLGNLVVDNAQQDYFFADGVHPTGKAHKTLADYAYMVTTAPSQLATLVQLVGRPMVWVDGKEGVWVDLSHHNDTLGSFDGNTNQVRIGVGVLHAKLAGTTNPNSKAITGAFILSDTANWQGNDIHFDNKKTGIGIYHHNTLGKIHLKTQAQFAKIDGSNKRQVALGEYRTAHHGTVKGKTISAGVQMGTPLNIKQTSIEPYLGVHIDRTSLDKFTEQSNLSTALSLDNQRYQKLTGVAGVTAQLPLTQNWIAIGDIHYQDTLSDKQSGGKASLNSLPKYTFTTPTPDYDDKGLGASIGVQGNMGKVGVQLSANYQKGDDQKEVGGRLAINYQF